jgi:hypothetical protein
VAAGMRFRRKVGGGVEMWGEPGGGGCGQTLGTACRGRPVYNHACFC